MTTVTLKRTRWRIRRRRRPPRTPWGIYFRLLAVGNGLLFVTGCLLGEPLKFVPSGIAAVTAWRAAQAVECGDSAVLGSCGVVLVALGVVSGFIDFG